MTLLLMLWLTACSNQEVVDKEPEATPARLLKLKVSMPGEGTKSGTLSTRLTFTETEEGTITVQWKTGDKINLCFVSEDGTVVRTVPDVPVANISKTGNMQTLK